MIFVMVTLWQRAMNGSSLLMYNKLYRMVVYELLDRLPVLRTYAYPERGKH